MLTMVVMITKLNHLKTIRYNIKKDTIFIQLFLEIENVNTKVL